jgi:ATP phosphoribosyltransferase regulatory subunit
VSRVPTQGAPEGTRYELADAARCRRDVLSKLNRLYERWGYAQVELPVLEHYDPAHPRALQSFKLSDRHNGVLALRSDFTPALAGLVHHAHSHIAAGANEPLRLQYAGRVWHAIDPDLARTREFTQVGIELIGISNARADAELIHLARESVREVGLAPRVEIGNPGFVRALLRLSEIPEDRHGALADAIDRKDSRDIEAELAGQQLTPDLRAAFHGVTELYGGLQVLEAARLAAPWAETTRELDRLEATLSEFEDDSELLLDLGMARRLSYYTGVTFRAYTFDFGQPLLGGGRYDGALLPYAAGFAIGLERLMLALPESNVPPRPLVVSLDDAAARRLRAAGFSVQRALTSDIEAVRRDARSRGIPYLFVDSLEPLVPDPPARDLLERALSGDDG